MQSAKLTKETIDYKMMLDWWNFRQENYRLDSLEEFEELLEKGIKLAKKYNDNEFFVDLIITHYNDIERRYKEEHKDWKELELKRIEAMKSNNI